MKTYRVVLTCHVRAKSEKKAMALLNPAVVAVMQVAPTRVAITAEEATP